MQIRPSAYIPTSPVSFFLFFLPRGNYSLVKRICFYKGRPAIMYIYMHPTFHTHTLSSLSSLPLHPPSSHLISSSQPQSSQETPLKKTNTPRIPTPPPNYQPLSKHTRSYRREPTVNTGKRFSRNRTRASRAFAAGVCFLAFPKPCEKKNVANI